MTALALVTLLAQYQSPAANDRVFAPPSGYHFDGRVEEWPDAGSQPLLGVTASGIVLAGRGWSPHLRLELHLAAPRDFVPPPPGSLGRFGYTIVEDCTKPDSPGVDPAQCRDWLAKTKAHHAELAQLMQRGYLITPNGVKEVVSTPAWHRLQSTLKLPPHLKRHPLAPGPLPQFRAAGDTFEVEIPWEALPPMEHTPLTSFRWAWRLTGDEAAEPPGWRTAVLMQPRPYRFTECAYSLHAYPHAEVDPVWYRPGSQLLIHDVVHFRYPFQLYWVPDALSPEVEIATAFEDRLEPGVWFCGPAASQMWHGHSSTARPHSDAWRGGHPAPGNYRKQRLPDGTWLIATAPHEGSYGFLGGGQCGACVVWTSLVWHASPSGLQLIETFQSPRIDGSVDWDIHYGADLRYVDIYTDKTPAFPPPGTRTDNHGWTRQRYCYSNGRYRPCGAAVRQAPTRRVTRPPDQ